MDDKLVELVAFSEAARQIRFKDLTTAELEIERDGQQQIYTLKPMAQLFAESSSADSIDMSDDDSLALLMTIEGAIVIHDDVNPRLTDGQVALTLRALAMNPEAEIPGDPLATCINRTLRLFLSFNDYSRQEVKLAIRKILQSVQWHNREAGPRGYLSFIREHVPAC